MMMLQIPKYAPAKDANAQDAGHQSILQSSEEKAIADDYAYCIENHRLYCQKHGYQFHLETTNYVGRMAYWQKIFSIMRLMAVALQDNSLDWIFWSDSDTLILNDRIRLESFIPPQNDAWTKNDSEVHLLMARDHRGWNNGVFMIRVHPWSLAYLARTYTWPDYHPRFKSFEQSAMARLYEEFHDVRRHMVRVPMRWFNAYPAGHGVYVAKKKDFQVHFPGEGNKAIMHAAVENARNGRYYKHNVTASGRGRTLPEDNMTHKKFWRSVIDGEIERGQVFPHQ